MWSILGICIQLSVGGIIAWCLWTLHGEVSARLADVAEALRNETDKYAQKIDIYILNKRMDSIEARITDIKKNGCPKCCDDDRK